MQKSTTILLIVAGILVISFSLAFFYQNNLLNEAKQAKNAEISRYDSLMVVLDKEGKVTQQLRSKSDLQAVQLDEMSSVLVGIMENMDQIAQQEAMAKSLIQKSSREYRNNLIASNDYKKIEAQINQYMDVMYQTLNVSRSRVEDLQGEIEVMADENRELRSFIENLEKLIYSQEKVINRLQEEKATLLSELQVFQMENQELKKAFFIVATYDELKKANIIEKKFLQPTRINELKPELFKTTEVSNTEIFLGDRKFKDINILSNQKLAPELYSLTDDGKTLKILNPSEFWRISKYLIVEVDY